MTTGHKLEVKKLNISEKQRADILVQALPYIKHFSGKTVVVKYGGSSMIDEKLKNAVMTDIILLSLVGIHVVLIHGGGPEINDMLKKIGKEPKFVNGLRYTDEETMEIVQMVLAGKVNKSLTQLIESQGGRALGLCGIDGGMLKAKKLSDGDYGLVGELDKVDIRPITDALANGYIPVVSPIAAGENGEVYNINADTAAARIAAELSAEKLILMTDIKGLLRDKNDESTLIEEVDINEVMMLKRNGIISGGMIPKIDCCVEAVRRGVKSTTIIDGRVKHSIIIEMLSREGVGTMLVGGKD